MQQMRHKAAYPQEYQTLTASYCCLVLYVLLHSLQDKLPHLHDLLLYVPALQLLLTTAAAAVAAA